MTLHVLSRCHTHSPETRVDVFVSSDTMGNKGAFVTLQGGDLKPNFTAYEAVVSSMYHPVRLYLSYLPDVILLKCFCPVAELLLYNCVVH